MYMKDVLLKIVDLTMKSHMFELNRKIAYIGYIGSIICIVDIWLVLTLAILC